jgi:hypothetical protein
MTLQPIHGHTDITPVRGVPQRLTEWAEEAKAAHALAQSLCKTPFAGQFKGDEYGATAAILRGAEMGITPVTALAAFDLIQGQPAPKALTLRALVQSHGHRLDIIESTPERAVARYRRADEAEWKTCEFTLDDARGLQLLGKQNWKQQPRTMLEARVTAKAARLVAADVILGIGYTAEELRDQPNLVVAGTVEQPRVTAADITGPPADASAAAMTDKQRRTIFALFGDLGLDGDEHREQQLDHMQQALRRRPASRGELSSTEAATVIDHLSGLVAEAFPPAEGEPS